MPRAALMSRAGPRCTPATSRKSIGEALKHKGFSFIEVITPCTTLYQRRNRLGDGLDAMEYYHDDADIQHGADTRTVDIGYQGKIAMGKFVDRPRATYLDAVNDHYVNVIGDDYELYGKTPMEKKAEEEARKSAAGTGEAADIGEDGC